MKKRTVDGGTTLEIWVQFRRSEPWRSFAGFQSKHVYCNMFDPLCLIIKFFRTASPVTSQPFLWRIHGDRESEESWKSRSTENSKTCRDKTRWQGLVSKPNNCKITYNRYTGYIYIHVAIRTNESTKKKGGIKS